MTEMNCYNFFFEKDKNQGTTVLMQTRKHKTMPSNHSQ